MPPQGKGVASAPVAIPTTRAELDVLAARRSELNHQLRSLSENSNRLVNERREAQANQNQAVVSTLDERIAENIARTARIEREKLALDDAISAGIARLGVSENVQVALPPPPPGQFPADVSVPPFELEGPSSGGGNEREAILGAFTLITLALIAWRWAVGRRRDRMKASQLVSGESQATKDLRVAVETIAVEVERISENQRFITKLLSEKQRDPALIDRSGSDRS